MEEIFIDFDFFFPFLAENPGFADGVPDHPLANDEGLSDKEDLLDAEVFEDVPTTDYKTIYWPFLESYSRIIDANGAEIRLRLTLELSALILPGISTEFVIPECIVVYSDDLWY